LKGSTYVSSVGAGVVGGDGFWKAWVMHSIRGRPAAQCLPSGPPDAALHALSPLPPPPPRNFTPKPMPLLEAQASNVAKAVIDMNASVIAVFTDSTQPTRLVAKYKPGTRRRVGSVHACVRVCSHTRACVVCV
jgi:hypothetical protein